MSTDLKHPIRFSEENTVPVFRDEKHVVYPPRNQSQWLPNTVSYPPNQPYAYNKSFSANRTSYTTTTTMPRTPPPRPATPSGLYPNMLQGKSSPVIPVQPPNSPAQLPGPPREVCLECMMRDEDMADVDVTGPGVWDRESDVYYRELCAREEEEEREREGNGYPSPSSATCSSSSEPRPRAKGAPLTEGNLKVWLTLNPREPAAKHQTLHQYLDAQNALLAADARARLKALQESRQLDDKMRDAYSQLRRSAYDLGASASALEEGGIKIRSSSLDDAKHKRDTTLLENGMIVERVDVRKEEARLRKEERRARKVSRDSLNVLDNRDRERDAMSLYSYQAAEGSASLRGLTPHESTMSVPMPTSRSVRSMYTTPSSSWQPQLPSRPKSLAPISGSIPSSMSQTSLETPSTRRRFFGLRHFSGYFSSSTSLAPSGSMMDMHLALDQEKHLLQIPQVDIGSNAPSLREAQLEDSKSLDPASDRNSSIKKKKRRGLGLLWGLFAGASNKTQEHQHSDQHIANEAEDEDLPLAPPPPLSYLVNRSSAQSERSMNMVVGRHLSMPSLTSLSPHHPRSSSTPSGVGLSVSSPSEKSSTLPSPIEVRFPYRDSSGDEPEEDDVAGDGSVKVKKQGSSPKRPFISNVSEPDIRRLLPLQSHTLPISRNGPPSSSSLAPTIKIPPARPLSVMSLDKNLPPLPPGEYELVTEPLDTPTIVNATFPLMAHSQTGLPAPNAGFNLHDPKRRQSFGGLVSRPALPRGARPSMGPSAMYDDFGVSRHSLAGLEPLPVAKRRLRFGLGALLGRKERNSEEKYHRDVPGLSVEPSYDLFAVHTGAPLMSERPPLSGLNPTRRQLEEFVSQEPDFVAYRYPSRDERLDLSRG